MTISQGLNYELEELTLAAASVDSSLLLRYSNTNGKTLSFACTFYVHTCTYIVVMYNVHVHMYIVMYMYKRSNVHVHSNNYVHIQCIYNVQMLAVA